MRLSLKLYRVLVKLYPAGFRDEYGVPLERQFRDDYADVTGRRELLLFWLRTLADVVRSAPQQLAREIGQDARYALRVWCARPLHTAFAIAALAVAMGATAGVFSVLNALLLRSLPFQEPKRLAMLQNFGAPRDVFHDWRRESKYLADATTYDSIEVSIEGVHDARRSRLTETSWNFFSVLGREPALGRGFAAGEDAAGRNTVAVIGNGLWRQLFGGDIRAVGSTIRVNGLPLTVIGVAQPDFDYPAKTDIWSPTTFEYERVPKTGTVVFWTTIGRLRPGVTWQQARDLFEAEAYERSPDRRQADAANRPLLLPLQDQLAGPVRSASLVLMGGVALLLLLACANIANLLLARTAARANELAIRAALGATRARLAQQLLTEALLLSAVATVAGLFVAAWSARLAALAQPAQLSTQSYTVLEPRVLAFSIALTVVTALVFGIAPALYASRGRIAASGRTNTPGRRQARLRTLLVGTQIAVTIVLVTAAVGLGRAFVRLLQADSGYDVRSLVTLNVSLAGTPYEDGASYYAALLERIRAVPDVQAVSGTQSSPLSTDGFSGGRYNVDNSGEPVISPVISVLPGFFSTIGAQVLAGREFSEDDLRHGTPIVVVNDVFARAYGGPAAVVGRHLSTNGRLRQEIVGVVRSLRYGAEPTTYPQVFRMSRGARALTVVANVGHHTRERIGMLRDAARSVDPKVPVFDVQTMEERLDSALSRQRFYATAVTSFGGLGLLLAVVGLYGLITFSVAQRTREMGIRLALGTTAGRLRSAILRGTLGLVCSGAVAGVAVSLLFGRYLQSLVSGANDRLLATTTAAVIITVLIGVAATWSATRRIARLDIADVLRAESAD